MSAELEQKYEDFLKELNAPLKIPFIEAVRELTEFIPVTYETTSSGIPLPDSPTWEVLRYINVKMLNKSRESVVQIYQRALPIKTFGRLRGNMAYVEDAWDIQIQPIPIRYAYLKNNVFSVSEAKQTKIRDKYLKVRVRYDGKQYAIINAIKTYFTISYA